MQYPQRGKHIDRDQQNRIGARNKPLHLWLNDIWQDYLDILFLASIIANEYKVSFWSNKSVLNLVRMIKTFPMSLR